MVTTRDNEEQGSDETTEEQPTVGIQSIASTSNNFIFPKTGNCQASSSFSQGEKRPS